MRIFKIFVLFIISFSSFANVECLDDTFCLSYELEGDITHVFGENKQYFHLTARVNPKMTDMDYIAPNLNIYQFAPLERKKLYSTILTGPNGRISNQFSWVIGGYQAEHSLSQPYHLPYTSGTTRLVSQSCDDQITHHTPQSKFAIDFEMPIGSEVVAARAGRVVQIVQSAQSFATGEMHHEVGNYIIIEHADLTLATYYHLDKNSAFVLLDQFVSAGQTIGLSGNSGFSTGPHLHFSLTRTLSNMQRESLKANFISSGGYVTCPKRGKRYQSARL